jgi:hypothetical protein
MRTIPSLAFTGIAVVLAGDGGLAGTTDGPAPTAAETTPAPTGEAGEKAWSFSLSAYTYFVPDSHDYVQPTFAADRDWLHLEARYNYEDLDTASTWIGYNLGFGEEVALEFTPMVGGVFGSTMGVSPGYESTLSWWKLELYSEGEYVFDANDSSDSFFYTWSELTLAPVDLFRFGLVVQRTKVYETDFDIQRGILLGLTYNQLDLTTCIFNLDDSHPMVVVGVGLSF